jgi:hypothetical protein
MGKNSQLMLYSSCMAWKEDLERRRTYSKRKDLNSFRYNKLTDEGNED